MNIEREYTTLDLLITTNNDKAAYFIHFWMLLVMKGTKWYSWPRAPIVLKAEMNFTIYNYIMKFDKLKPCFYYPPCQIYFYFMVCNLLTHHNSGYLKVNKNTVWTITVFFLMWIYLTSYHHLLNFGIEVTYTYVLKLSFIKVSVTYKILVTKQK